MDYWAENQGHLPQYNKFSTVPVRSCGQNFSDRQQTAHYPVYCGDQRDKSMDSGYWPVQDIPNWANPDVNPTSPQYFPFHLDRPIQQHYQDFGEHQEARNWTSFQHNREPERGLQREGWSYSPVRYKRDISKKNESNFRELEAWAMRYSHSLPRRRRIEAELRGTLQGGLPDRGESRELQMPNIRDSTLWERSSNQQAQNYYFASPTSQNLDTKDKVSYQTKLFTHPPNYNAPPPYTVQHKNVPTLQRFEKQSYKLQPEQDREMHEKRMMEIGVGNVEAKQIDVMQENSQVQLVQVKPISEASKIIEGRKFKLNKKSGGMTIFCLVSRIADTERETLPISQTKCEVVDQKSCNVSQTLKLADEVDFKSPVQTSTKHLKSPYSKLKAIPICKTLTDSLSKMADKNSSKVDDASTIGKQAVQAKYPLWRRPSFTSSSETDNMCPAKDANANIQGQESGSDSCVETETESAKVHKEAKNNDAMLMIDTTCVVVKMEVLQAPVREQVHYLSSSKTSENDQNLVSDSVQCKGDSQPKQQDNENVDELNILERKSDEISMDVLEKAKSEVKQQTNSELVSENSEDRAKRIIGLIESTTVQLDKDEIGDLDVEVQDPPKTNKDTNDLHGEEGNEELQLDLLADKMEDLCQSNSCKDKRTNCSAEIVELDAIERDNKVKDENVEIVEIQQREIIGNLHETKDVEDPSDDIDQATEIDPTMDISDTLELSKEPDNAILLTTSEDRLSPLQFHAQDSEQTTTNLTQTEVEEDIESLSAQENSGTPPLTSLIDPKNDHLDKAFTEEVSEKDFEDENQVNEQVHGELGVSNMSESKSGETEDVILAIKEKIADVTSNEVEMPKESTLKANDLDNVQVESSPKEEAPILEELSEIVQKQKQEIIEKVNCKLNGQDMAQFQSSPINEVDENMGYSDGENGIGIITSDLEMHEEAIVKDHEYNTIQKLVDSSQIEDATCSEEQSKQVDNSDLEIDILVEKVEADKEVELETQKDLQEQFECQDLHNSSNYMKLDAEVDESLHPPSLIEPKVEIQLECNQNQGNEELKQIQPVSDQIDNISCIVSKDIEITTSDLDIVGDATVEDDGEYGQIQGAAKESLTADEKLEDIDVFDKLHKKATEPCSKVVSEKYVQTFAKELDNTVPTYKLAKTKSPDKLIQEDNDLQEQYEVCEEAQSTACVNDKICDNVKVATENLESQQETEFAVATNSILQSEVQTQPTNNNTNISESFNSSLDTCDQSISSISTMSDVFENIERETEEKYPKSLWDAVSRIRKHTAPDSENEEEEVTDNWDRESLADNLGTIDRDGGAFDQDLQYVDADLERVKEELLNISFEDENLQDDQLSQSSNSSQTSEETIVDDELENATMENCEMQDLSGAREENVCDGDSVNKKLVDKCPGEKLEDTKMSEEIML